MPEKSSHLGFGRRRAPDSWCRRRHSPGGLQPPLCRQTRASGRLRPRRYTRRGAGGGGGADFTPGSLVISAHHVSAEWGKTGIFLFFFQERFVGLSGETVVSAREKHLRPLLPVFPQERPLRALLNRWLMGSRVRKTQRTGKHGKPSGIFPFVPKSQSPFCRRPLCWKGTGED